MHVRNNRFYLILFKTLAKIENSHKLDFFLSEKTYFSLFILTIYSKYHYLTLMLCKVNLGGLNMQEYRNVLFPERTILLRRISFFERERERERKKERR